jgi:hypothetical protein
MTKPPPPTTTTTTITANIIILNYYLHPPVEARATLVYHLYPTFPKINERNYDKCIWQDFAMPLKNPR